MVYVGANDGMLHAFKLGTLSVASSGFQKASLTGTNLGSEQWAFIPTNSLPYLKYMSDTNYSHLYSIDGRTVIFDASIGDISGGCTKSTYYNCNKFLNDSVVDSSNNLDSTKNTWRTVLLSGMGMGGASRSNVGTETCTEGASGTCVKTPTSDYGLSSYTALDVTDPNNPKYLWEFSDNLMGFSTSAPAIVRIGDKNKNGHWFAVFGNGPFGPIDPVTHQFKAESNHTLRFYIVDLNATPPFVLNTNYWIKETLADGSTINNAFVGTLLGGSIDADRRDMSRAGNYQDDAIYAGYVMKGSDNKWTDGGVVRIMTGENPDPSTWVVSKVIDGIGPVTTAIARSQDTKNRNLWLYFGTGRYYYRDAELLDDNDNSRSLFGIMEPCYNTTARPGNFLDPACATTLSVSNLENQTTSITSLDSNKGWRIDLAAATTGKVCSTNYTTSCNLDSDCPASTPKQSCNKYGAERVVTDTVALTNGTVFFTSFKPNMDICGYGGNSYLWGVKYDTGGAAAVNALQGKALIQLSTGEFKEVDLSQAFTDTGSLNRRMATPMTGKPPSDAPPIIGNSQNKPLKKILHIKER
jgi:type IV pilus assembly protein PilY1